MGAGPVVDVLTRRLPDPPGALGGPRWEVPGARGVPPRATTAPWPVRAAPGALYGFRGHALGVEVDNGWTPPTPPATPSIGSGHVARSNRRRPGRSSQVAAAPRARPRTTGGHRLPSTSRRSPPGPHTGHHRSIVRNPPGRPGSTATTTAAVEGAQVDTPTPSRGYLY